MEIFELIEKRRAFAPPELRYKNPYQEAIKLRKLWSYYKTLSKSEEMREAKRYYKQASKLIENAEPSRNVIKIIAKGLYFNPRYHVLYGLRGDVYSSKGDWSKAINSYEAAKLTTKFDFSLGERATRILYNAKLIECYSKRGDQHYENTRLIEAMGDYEQALHLESPTPIAVNIQDKFLEILMTLDKYELFQHYWEWFVRGARDERLSNLLTALAAYKIHQREMAVGRHVLLEALRLKKDNVRAQELLQVVYRTGHMMTGYTIIWCLHGCYDKALMTIEKALDCNPFNPGFTMLKTVILRLSGRLDEAVSWLESVSRNFYKLLEPSADTEHSITGKLSISETRNEMIRQWYLTKYNKALKNMVKDQLETAARVIYGNKLTDYCAESHVLLGDCFLKRGNVDLAMKSYLKYRETSRKFGSPVSEKHVEVMKRIADILNDRAEIALRQRRPKEALKLSDRVLGLLDEDRNNVSKLGVQRGRALLHKTRGIVQTERLSNRKDKRGCKMAADSLRFIREPCETGLYRTLYGEKSLEDTIDRFGSKQKLPRSLKILMQYS
ncbi:hypothetical protein WN55_05502 [Dufourea novaeangliae]|uniref:Uncharacterized protein n=1 Tax=Dufourea novaeangliae TaxID=178035 RepID=A0A154PMY8_DUFNO|nr:hypothetical protein WN55_05502 [Dufourea novaeangliae]